MRSAFASVSRLRNARRQAVGAVLERRAAQRPQGVLQSFGQGHEAFAAQDDVGVFEARIGEAEVV